jgi:GTP cyclohydrolase I
MKLEKLLTESLDEMGDQHQGSSKETPLRPDAFDMSNTEKYYRSKKKFRKYCIFWEWILQTTV